jgi:hypothetical protein
MIDRVLFVAMAIITIAVTGAMLLTVFAPYSLIGGLL